MPTQAVFIRFRRELEPSRRGRACSRAQCHRFLARGYSADDLVSTCGERLLEWLGRNPPIFGDQNALVGMALLNRPVSSG